MAVRGGVVVVVVVLEVGAGQLAAEVVFHIVGCVQDAASDAAEKLFDSRSVDSWPVAFRRVRVVWVASGKGKWGV